VSVSQIDPRTVHEELTRNVLSTGAPSRFSEIVLAQRNLAEQFRQDPEGVLQRLHADAAAGEAGPDDLFALAEFFFFHAERTKSRPHYLASALYAYAFLFPAEGGDAPSAFDPRFRVACDLYGRGLTAGLASPAGSQVAIGPGTYPLPFGRLDVAFDPAQLRWSGRTLGEFVPVAELKVKGLHNRYRQPGLGMALAASLSPGPSGDGVAIPPRVKVPLTAVLRVQEPMEQQLAAGHVRASLELYAANGGDTLEIDGRTVPLEAEPTAALAYLLSGSRAWEFETRGFFAGDLLDREFGEGEQLFGAEPYRPGRIPVVFVHGTASGPARWAEMLNELQNDPRLRDRFQFWFFAYETGNPILVSALHLRESLEAVAASVDPLGQDAALPQMVLIGHSQGGLLVRLVTAETGTAFWDAMSHRPLEDLNVSADTKQALRKLLYLKPLPLVRRTIFLATPHGGSYVAGNWLVNQVYRFIRLPRAVLQLRETLTREPEVRAALKVDPKRISSGYAMTPGSPLVKALAATPLAPGVAAHSIIAVRGDGPVTQGEDGVVAYRSAHLDGVESELVVPSGHTMQNHPYTIAEVKRILLGHADAACRAGVACPEEARRQAGTRAHGGAERPNEERPDRGVRSGP
jgi:pimeloyl-ACP methyl ester carboxylesterase